jgi:hypothetical protein
MVNASATPWHRIAAPLRVLFSVLPDLAAGPCGLSGGRIANESRKARHLRPQGKASRCGAIAGFIFGFAGSCGRTLRPIGGRIVRALYA